MLKMLINFFFGREAQDTVTGRIDIKIICDQQIASACMHMGTFELGQSLSAPSGTGTDNEIFI